MDTAFYSRFDRHAHGEGLKAHASHYCAGCGHGIIHKYVAEVVEELGIQDRTVAISPVGCAVFLYYYLDVGNSQAAHGRAPAVALGHKLANPESIVISYQGDGDLASIGLTEIIQVAQMGLPITVIFVNNAIYGMTGGQMAPTTLMHQQTMTTPDGRSRLQGEPLKMAEMMAGLDGPVYVERVALFNTRQRVRAKKAITKALRMQIENRGFAFVEILSECPTHWHMTPLEAERWVEETMSQVYPLGVKKDLLPEPWFEMLPPVFDADRIFDTIGTTSEAPVRFGARFPVHIDPNDVAVKMAGSGGDGAQTVAKLLCHAAINEGFDATYIPSYGPESRGGTSFADVHVAAEEVLSPSAAEPHVLVAFNAPSLTRFGSAVRKGGIVLYDETVIAGTPDLKQAGEVLPVPFTGIAQELGSVRVKNMVAAGALQAATGILPEESLLATIRSDLKGTELNTRAFRAGQEAVIRIRTIHKSEMLA